MPVMPAARPVRMIQFGCSSLVTSTLISIVQMGMHEQIMAANPLDMYTSAHPTTVMPSVTMKKPAMA